MENTYITNTYITNDCVKQCWYTICLGVNKEYWTFIEGSEEHYEISNWGRIRNASSKRLIKLQWNKKRKDYCFNLNYQCKGKKVFLKRLLYTHFIGDLNLGERVYLENLSGGVNLCNLKTKLN